MKNLLITLILIFVFQITFSQIARNKDSSITIGSVIHLESTFLNENREINIYLPDSYNANDSVTYPVIYLLDGALNEDFFHVTGLIHFMSLYEVIPETIVIGIANKDRKRDFTYPTTIQKDKIDYPTTGGSDNFINFIEKELIPNIDSVYKTNDSRTIIGQSLGGLLCTEILFKNPYLFTNYFIVSPSLWWDNGSLLNQTPMFNNALKKNKISVLISVGDEGEIMVNKAKELSEILKKPMAVDLQSSYHFFPKENHATILHIALYESFKLLYSPPSNE